MATLGTQLISTSYSQVLKTFGSDIVGPTLAAVSSGNEAGVSALQISTTGVKSSGTFAVDGASTLLGPVTFGSHITASTGTATIATASISTATISTATISTATISTATISTATIGSATFSTATIPLQLGPVTFGSNVTMSTGTATIGTLSAGSATISTATIPTVIGATTFATGFTSSTGTNTLGTIASATINNTGIVTVGTLELAGTAGPNITSASFGSTTIGATTLGTMTTATSNSTGTFAMTGIVAGDIVLGQANLAFTGAYPMATFSVAASNVARYSLFNASASSLSTITGGTLTTLSLRTTS